MVHYTPSARIGRQSFRPIALALILLALIMVLLYFLPRITDASPPPQYKAAQGDGAIVTSG